MTQVPCEMRTAVLLFTDIVGSAQLKTRHGIAAYRKALLLHNNHFERIARECRGIRILQNLGDGYFAVAASVTEAVRCALLFQDAMRVGPWTEVRVSTRVGIHAGEVSALSTEGGSGILAPAADLAARVMGLAVGGQILLTRFPFDEARHFLRDHPAIPGRDTPLLRWLAHGPYLLKGCDEPIEVFEVGAEGLAPLASPPDGEKAKRAVRPGEEETLGWRPAIGLEIPGRAGWRLLEQLGAGGFGEVWKGEHAKLGERRAFKFCFDTERLRALKREVTLVRLLRTTLGDRDDIVRLHELRLHEPPFYLESDLAPHGNLLQWAEKQGGLTAIPIGQRIGIVADTATALAAAHSIGVLHKDIKPTNILVFDGPNGSVRPRLVDFGLGTLADASVLEQHGITAAGFTRTGIQHSTGTPTYSPPEYVSGKAYTVQGDIYGLGVLLYQLVTADSSRPIAHGWERDVTDPLLREDIAACVEGKPERRLPSPAVLADRLLRLDQRRAEIAEKERLADEAAEQRKQLDEKLRNSEALYRSLVETMPQNILRKDLDGRFTFANQRLCKMLGSTLDNVIGKTDFDFFASELAEKYQRDDRHVLTTGEPYETVEEHQPLGSRKLFVQVVKTPLRDANGAIMGLQTIFWDITQQRQAEQEIRRVNALLAQSRKELRAKNLQMEEDLKMAREIQLTMLPQQYPIFPRPGSQSESALQFTHRYLPTGTVGGDFFTVSALSDHEAGVFICDVAGHGVRSALITAMIRALLEELKPLASNPGQFLTKLNSDLFAILRHTGTPMLTTAFYLVVDLQTATLRYASAGHPKPLHLCRSAGKVITLANAPQRSQPALGFCETTSYQGQMSETQLAPGDLVLLFTNGLVDVQNQNEQLYNQDLLLAAVQQRLQLPAPQLFDEILEEVHRFSAAPEFTDDVCLVGVELPGFPL